MASEAAASWNCGEFAEVLTQLDTWLENGFSEHGEANSLPEALSCSSVQSAVEAQRRHLEAREALPEAVGHVLDVLARLWQALQTQAHEKRCMQPSSSTDKIVEELSRRLEESESELAVTQEERAEATDRENQREMRLCRMMAQEAREAAELRQSLRRSEQSAGQAGHSDAVEEKNKAVSQLERCQQELAKAQKRNNELLKDLKMLCTPSSNSTATPDTPGTPSPNAGEPNLSIPSTDKPVEDRWNPMTGFKAIFGENTAATLSDMMRLGEEKSGLTPRTQGAYGSFSKHMKVNAPAESAKDSSGATPRGTTPRGTTPRGGSRTAAMTPRSLSGKETTTPRGMPSSMRELAQILAPQKIVPVDQASPEARINQLQKVVRELTNDLRERDARIKKLVTELRRVQNSCNGVMNLEVLEEDDDFAMQDTAPMSARGVRGESGSISGLGPGTSASNRPKFQLNLTALNSEESFNPQPRQTAQSAR